MPSQAQEAHAPPYESCTPLGSSQRAVPIRSRSEREDEVPETIIKSARYPRVAVLLGVNQHYYIPLLICRSSSTVFTFIWATQASFSIYHLLYSKGQSPPPDVKNPHVDTVLVQRLQYVQIVLSFLWAAEAAYLSHLFASSLMSRWLLHYSPAAVLVRLCSLSIFLAYGCTTVFRLTGALDTESEKMSRSLLIWIATCICLLVSYFTTQQDMSIEKDRDNRKRRLILRLKCLYTMAASSLFSLLVLLVVIHVGSRTMVGIWSDAVSYITAILQQTIATLDRMKMKDEL